MNKDIYKNVKHQLDARAVVKDFLGEPKAISGETYKWCSPFRDGDSDPSFCANSTEIKDFGGEFYGDIFNFVSTYNNISNQEALDYIIEMYDINLPLEYTNTKKPMIFHGNKLTATIINTIGHKLELSEKVTEEIYCMFDTVGFTQKPDSKEIGRIKNKISDLEPLIYNLDEIKKQIITGHTCIPAGIKSQQDWQDDKNFMQIFMVDVDNVKVENGEKKNFTIDDEGHITVDNIIHYCKEINLLPTFAYSTFSNSEHQHKFRLVYILEVGSQKQDEIKGIYDFLKDTFKEYNIDTAPTNIATLFLGGKEIIYESNNFYTIKQVEVEKIVNNVEIVDNAELALAINSLANTEYMISNGKIGQTKKSDFVPISNFITYISEKQNFINGRDIETKYIANCLLLDEPNKKLPPQAITIEEYSKYNFILGSSWDKYAIIKAGTTNPAKLREITQLISKNTMIEKNIYAHSGFTRIDDKLIFLYHNGVIGNAENIDVDLSGEKLERYCFTNKTFDLKEALKSSLSFLELADKKITIPILSTVYLAPLFSLLSKKNIHADYILFLQGKTGTRKSSLSALALCHYGNFDRDHFPSSFRDTTNSIEKKAFITKDLLNVIDDFNPEVNGKQKLETMEKLYAMYGDRVGRTRMSKDGSTLKLPYTARGLCLVTGEVKPDVAQSRIARSLFINLKQDSLNLQKLTELQNNSEQLSFAMMNFIQWVIDNEAELMNNLVSKFKSFRENQDNQKHGRTNEIINVLILGFTAFLQFILEKGVITIEKKNKLEEQADILLNELVEEQTTEIEELKPTEMFYNAIDQLFSTKAIQVLDYGTGCSFENSSGTNVGFYNSSEKMYYFFPDIIYQKVVEFYNKQNVKFPINSTTLWKYMNEENLLYVRQKADRLSMRRTINKVSYKVIGVKSQNEPSFKTNINPFSFKKNVFDESF